MPIWSVDPTTTATETAAWITAASGISASGILVMVLRWLAFTHLPNKDRQIKEMLDSHKDQIQAKDKQIDSILDHKWLAIEKLSEDRRLEVAALAAEFRSISAEQNKHCDEENSRLIAHCDKEIDRLERWLESRIGEKIPRGPVA